MDFWDERKTFEQSGQFIVNDWTTKILTLDIQNSIGELYYFEIEPNADVSKIPTRASDDPGSGKGKDKDFDKKVIVHITLPIATSKK